MNIIINTIPLLSPLTGVGNYTYNITKSLQEIDHLNNYTYFYGYYSKKLLGDNSRKRFHYVKEIIRGIPFLRDIAREFKNILSNFSNKDFDLYFEPNFIPINIKAKHIVATVCDFSFKLYPQWHPKDRITYFENKFWKNIERADRIIVISNFIYEEAVNLFGFSKDRLKVIHCGFNNNVFNPFIPQGGQSVKSKYNLPDNFILFVGSIEPRKNLENLIHAYINLDKDIRNEFKIVIVGFKGWENKEFMNILNKYAVRYIGYVSEMELRELYTLATLFVFPSFYEGFGLPPLEAMACGCPVVVSNVASLPEVCGDAAYYVDPYSIESIADGMYKVLTDKGLRESLVRKGLERVKLFSWERCARETLKVFDEVYNEVSHRS